MKETHNRGGAAAKVPQMQGEICQHPVNVFRNGLSDGEIFLLSPL